jgi:hypothetical protein
LDGKSHNAKLCEKIRDGEENPFWTVEALGEHVQACWGALAEMGFDVWKRDEAGRATGRPDGEVGSIIYHLKAVNEYEQRVFNYMAALLPDLYRMSEGETVGLNKLKLELEELAKRHQRAWEKR